MLPCSLPYSFTFSITCYEELFCPKARLLVVPISRLNTRSPSALSKRLNARLSRRKLRRITKMKPDETVKSERKTKWGYYCCWFCTSTSLACITLSVYLSDCAWAGPSIYLPASPNYATPVGATNAERQTNLESDNSDAKRTRTTQADIATPHLSLR